MPNYLTTVTITGTVLDASGPAEAISDLSATIRDAIAQRYIGFDVSDVRATRTDGGE